MSKVLSYAASAVYEMTKGTIPEAKVSHVLDRNGDPLTMYVYVPVTLSTAFLKPVFSNLMSSTWGLNKDGNAISVLEYLNEVLNERNN